MTQRFDYDLLVIGAGSGGVRAARKSAEFGARVARACADDQKIVIETLCHEFTKKSHFSVALRNFNAWRLRLESCFADQSDERGTRQC